ncbi:MAG TPA: lamin tail domain-containing protein, partial [Anaerolineae bacterium]|nr:lamin tail domain-containing protein [Anaerolineae bacterium]
SAQVIDTANGDGGDWPAGDNTNKSTMERCDPLVADADANWASNDGITRNGLDAEGNPLNGTPKARNSAYVEPPPPAADLRATKTGPATASIGDTVEYSLSLYNDGQLQALASRLTDTLPSGVSFVAGSPPPTQQSGQSLVWVLGDLAPGAHQQLTVTGVITVGAPALLVNRLSARTSVTESALLNNTAAWTTTLSVEPPPPPHILINAVHFDGLASFDADEAVQLYNAGDAVAQLSGWELCKIASSNYACKPLPTMALPAHGQVWLTRDLTKFQAIFGFAADYLLSPWLSDGLANNGDEVILRDAEHHAVDTLVFGKQGDVAAAGWSDEALQVYQNNVGRAEGQLFYRIPDEVTGRPITDTDTLADWMQFTGDVNYGR